VQSESSIHVAFGRAEIDRCYSVMRQLRTALSAEEFAARVEVQQAEGYRLAYLEHEGAIVALAVFV